MEKSNSESPWNPKSPVKISPQEYEKQVFEWLKAACGTVEEFEVKHLEHIEGAGGEYEFDVVVRLTILNGAEIVILIECKRHSRPIEREKLLALWAKVQEVGAHKAMIFSTSGFQSGALNYARSHGIATITFVEGAYLYHTKGAGPSKPPPEWLNLPSFAGIFMTKTNTSIRCTKVDQNDTEVLSSWLRF